jgi:polyisoprenyl-phosphate glycosyltransferase
VLRREEQRPVVLSVVVPVYNEADTLPLLVERICAAIEPLEIGFEILCVDDGSRDATPAVLATLSQDHPQVRCVSFTRNFGKEAALQAGLRLARGEAAVFMDADLQHPPELIPRMVEIWRDDGADVVDARKRARGRAGALARAGGRVFNLMLGAAVDDDMAGSSDFKLLSREAMDALLTLPERRRFFRGLVHWIGFRTVRLDFDVEHRSAGRSRWSRLALLRYAIDNLISFTTFPLALIATLGLATTVFGAALGALALAQWVRGVALSGFTTVIVLIAGSSGLILTSLGVIALYLARIFEEIKGRPIFMIRSAPKPEDPERSPRWEE